MNRVFPYRIALGEFFFEKISYTKWRLALLVIFYAISCFELRRTYKMAIGSGISLLRPKIKTKKLFCTRIC